MEKVYLAIVTGGAQGIGLAITEALLKTGGKVHFLDISGEAGLKAQEELDKKYGKGRAKFVQCDVTKKYELEKSFYQSKEDLGGLNVICNNAGFGTAVFERSRWEDMIALNLGAAIYGCMLGMDLMDTGRGGSGGAIINISSTSALPPLMPAGAVYAATKASIIEYSRRVALTSMTKGIRINCICPGTVKTKLFEEATRDAQEMNLFGTEICYTEEYARAMALAPSEVADELIKLIKDESKNGEVLAVTKDKGVYFHKFSS